jgi:hypothetical protein
MLSKENVTHTLAAAAGITIGLWAWFAFVRPALGTMVGTKSVL